MDYSKYFKKGGWAAMGRYYATHPKKLKKLMESARQYASREGLKQARDEFLLICRYVKDVFTGQYRNYNALNLIVIVGAIVYVVTPVDALPDFLPATGLIDDTAILLWAAHEFGSELEKYKAFLEAKGASAATTCTEEIEDAEFEDIPPFLIEK